MNIIKKIMDKIMDIPRHEVISAHQEVLNSINRLSELIPPKYREYNLEKIVSPKAYGYHTILDTSYYQYIAIKKLIKKLLINEKISKYLSFKLVLLKRKKIGKAVRGFKDEIPIDFIINDSSLKDYDFKEGPYNIFFASTQTYLRVLILYINQSKLNNNLLVIPRFLSNVEVLNDFDKNKLVYFEDFINVDIIDKYKEAKKEFKVIFQKEKKYIADIFLLDSKNFFNIIEIGLENVFNYLLPQALLFSLINENLCNKIKIKNIIGARVRKIYDRGSYQVANKYNINRYVLLHSNIGTDKKFIDSMGHFSDLTGVFTWGPMQKKLIEEDPFSNVDDIFVTGSPLFSKLKNEKIDKKSKCILYAATKNDRLEVKSLVKIINTLPYETALIIKVHPDEDEKIYESFLNIKNVKIVSGEKSLENLLSSVDLLITTISESSLQAMIRGVPSLFLILNINWKKALLDLYGFNTKEKELFVIENNKLLKERIHNILKFESFRFEFLKEQGLFLEKILYLHSENNSASTMIDNILN